MQPWATGLECICRSRSPLVVITSYSIHYTKLYEKAETIHIPVLNLTAPVSLPNVDSEIMDPRNTYTSETEWEKKARMLAQKYIDNFEQYCDNEHARSLVHAGPQL